MERNVQISLPVRTVFGTLVAVFFLAGCGRTAELEHAYSFESRVHSFEEKQENGFFEPFAADLSVADGERRCFPETHLNE